MRLRRPNIGIRIARFFNAIPYGLRPSLWRCELCGNYTAFPECETSYNEEVGEVWFYCGPCFRKKVRDGMDREAREGLE